jgi:exopolyphosphatase/guanosine-5'-triphosphate,3'-diphosphate pyrophosphatase
MPARIAAIDVGSNSVKLLVADVAGAQVTEVERWGRVTRLVRGLARGEPVREEAAADTRDAIDTCAARARVLGAERLWAAATGGLRMAADPLGLASRLGEAIGGLPILEPRVEAALSLLGLRAGMSWPTDLVALDLGGSSTEVTRLSGPHLSTESLPIGAVVLTERCLAEDPPSAASRAALDRHLDRVLAASELDRSAAGAAPLFGVGGTISALAMMLTGLRAPDATHGRTLSAGEVERAFQTLASLDQAGRVQQYGISPWRADVVVAGARILMQIMEFLGSKALRVSAWGLRHGLVIAAAAAGPDARLHPEQAAALAGSPAPGEKQG